MAMESNLQKLKIYYDTISQLKLRMIFYRVYGRTLRTIIRLIPVKQADELLSSINKLIGNKYQAYKLPEFIPLQANYLIKSKCYVESSLIINGQIGAINEVTPVLSDKGISFDDWDHSNRSLLFRFNLNYFEWLWQLESNVTEDEFVNVVSRYLQSWTFHCKTFDAIKWSPYVISLRMIVLIDLHNRHRLDSDIDKSIMRQIILSYRILKGLKEYDVEGNHLIKNLKALIIADCYFGNSKSLNRHLNELKNTCNYQILKDGAHYERSMSYHVQVLSDLIDIHNALTKYDSATGKASHLVTWMTQIINRMHQWLLDSISPTGEPWAVNDCFRIDPDLIQLITNYCDREIIPHLKSDGRGLSNLDIASPDRLKQPEYSGYFTYRPYDQTKSKLSLLFDVGNPCPKELPAHSHADTFNVLLYFDQTPILCDTGVSTYEAGLRRSYERSSRAHNTVTIDNENSTQVWGSFRAGRKAQVTVENSDENNNVISICAHHDGFSHLSGAPVHTRQIQLHKNENKLKIFDTILGSGFHDIAWYFHLPFEFKLQNNPPSGMIVNRPLRFRYEPKDDISETDSELGPATINTFDLNIECQLKLKYEYVVNDPYLGTIASDFSKLNEGACLTLEYSGEIPIKAIFTFENFKLSPTRDKVS